MKKLLKSFISKQQQKALEYCLKGEERSYFKDMLDSLEKLITGMPKSYDQDGVKDPIVYLHYFWGGSDWYITEKDIEDEQQQAFGYAVLGGMEDCAEFGYISLVEVLANNIELDLYWTPKPLSEALKNRGK